MTVELRREALTLPSWTLTLRQLCDFELLANGGFVPLSVSLRRTYFRMSATFTATPGNGSTMP